MIKKVNSREIVLEILTDVLENNEFSHIALREKLKKYKDLDKTNRNFITRISEGTLENLIQIDYIINKFSKIKVKKMKPLIRNILRMSVYQLLYMDNVPNSAVCNEGVEIAKNHGFGPLKGFVNGVLRNIARNIDNIKYPDENTDIIKAYSIRYSMPEWIVSLWIKDFGKEKTKIILDGIRKHRPLCVRCNLSKAPREEIINSLSKQEITIEESEILSEGLFLSDYDNVESIKAHEDGLVSVQDISSMLVGKIASPKNGDYIIDVCAAPGGKSIHVADILNGSGHVDSRDISEYKINMIKENINRAGFSNIDTVIKDATVFDEESVSKADIIIADLPCSGLGVLSKKTDLKYNITEESLDSLVELQRDILKQIESYVKAGGVLIYSTCTVNKKENEENVKWFENNFPFSLESIDDYIPEELQGDTTKKGYLQLFPGSNNCDGFFIARFRRANE